jgi:hypothetical protein
MSKRAGRAINIALRNIARGRQSYRYQRWRIFSAIARHPSEVASPLSGYLARQLLDIDQHDWINLSISQNDLPIVARLNRATTEMTENYLGLATDYVVTNSRRVKELVSKRLEIEALLLNLSIEAIQDKLLELDARDQQSLYFLRAYSALHSSDPHALVDALRRNPCEFVRGSLSYPLVFYFTNLPADDLIDLQLAYIIPETPQFDIDRAIVRTLVHDESSHQPLAVRCYLALLAHPIDAYDLLLNYFEHVIASRRQLSAAETRSLGIIASQVSSPRSRMIKDIQDRKPIAYSTQTIVPTILQDLGARSDVGEYFRQCLSLSPFDAHPPADLDLIGLFHNLRSRRYPSVYEWEQVVGFARRYWFTDVGRLIQSLIVSMYLVPRRDEASELKHLFRLHSYVGQASPFTLSSPRALTALELELVKPISSEGELISREDIDSQVVLADVEGDRAWLKQVQWRLKRPQREMQISTWLAVVRQSIPVAPEYLTGLSWEWLDQVVDALRIAPFRGNADGVYVLLLRLIEQRKSESTRLRAAIEPLAEQAGVFRVFVDRLMEEYGQVSIAFFRYFLSPNLILLLRFTDNYIEALSFRITAIDLFVQTYGPTELFTPAQFQQELRAFETELMLLSVTGSEFEIVWEVVKKDVELQLEDLYKTHAAFTDASRDLASVLGRSKTKVTHRFSGGQLAEYPARSSDVPLMDLICAIIDLFLQHPSQGIESILSVRIRHINFSRQFSQAIGNLKREGGQHFRVLAHEGMIEVFEQCIQATVQRWLDKYMHQNRPDKPDALFDFVPVLDDFEKMVVSRAPTFDEVIDGVTSWIKARLEQALSKARDKLSELDSLLAEAIDTSRKMLLGSNPDLTLSISIVANGYAARIHNVVGDVRHWFVVPEGQHGGPATPEQMRMVIEGRYASEIEQQRLRIVMPQIDAGQFQIERGKVRAVYDLCCEVFNNALKHGRRSNLSVYVWPYRRGGEEGLIFSSNRDTGGEIYRKLCAGDPITASERNLFSEGNSGLAKIAALAAYIAGKCIEVHVDARPSIYRIAIPFRVTSD